MKMYHILIVAAFAVLIGGCAAAPKELVNARQAYERASTGPAAKVAPAEVHVAHQALAKAEQSFEDNSDSYQTRDLAYVAERKAQMAEATASITMEQKKQTRANNNYQTAQGQIIEETKQDLEASEASGEKTQDKLAAEKRARADAEKRAADAMAALAKLAMVKDEPRGMVITLSGSVLFASSQSTLLPEARTRLDQVADVLLTTRERNLTVEGHTDSQGSDGYNMSLSQSRADSVRGYLVQRGYQGDLIQAHGMGEAQPIANNANAEGRANNRRVEIIIQREPNSSNQISSNQ